MTLDEAIKHAQWVADTNCDQCAEDHRQLAEWLKELKELRNLGWHPASELPPVDENGNSSELIAITWDGYLMRAYFHQEREEYSFWVDSDDWNKQVKYGVNVKWWSYPPEEE